MNIVPIISSQGIHEPEQIPGDSYQGLYLLHPTPYHLLILLVHNPTPYGGIKGGKVEQFPQQRSTTLGYMPLPLVFSGAYLIEIKSRQFYNGPLPRETLQSPGLSYDPSHGNKPNTWNREQSLTVRDLFQLGGQLRLYLLNSLLYLFYLLQKQPYLLAGALHTLLHPYRGISRFPKPPGMPRAQLTPALLLHDPGEPLEAQRSYLLRARIMIK